MMAVIKGTTTETIATNLITTKATIIMATTTMAIVMIGKIIAGYGFW
jgi:hypothetical protein